MGLLSGHRTCGQGLSTPPVYLRESAVTLQIWRSVFAIAQRFEVPQENTRNLYQEFIVHAEAFNRDNDQHWRTPSWRLALNQVFRHLATVDLGALSLGNYFDYWRARAREEVLIVPSPVQDRPSRDWIGPKRYAGGGPDSVIDAATKICRRYGHGGQAEAASLFDKLLQITLLHGNRRPTDSEILDNLLINLSVSAGDLPITELESRFSPGRDRVL